MSVKTQQTIAALFFSEASTFVGEAYQNSTVLDLSRRISGEQNK